MEEILLRKGMGNQQTSQISRFFLFVLVLISDHLLLASTITNISAIVTKSADMYCRYDVTMYTSSTVYWYGPGNQRLSQNGVMAPGVASRFSIRKPYDGEMNLHIENLQTTDAGLYYCDLQPTNPAFQQFTNLTLLRWPTITDRSPANVTSRAGLDASIFCRANGTPPPLVEWFKYSYRGDRRIALNVTGELLTLTKVGGATGGLYECVADNGIPPVVVERIRFDVLFQPIITLPYEMVTQSAGKSTLLICHIMANPSGDFYWERGGKRIVTSSPKYDVNSYDTNTYTRMLVAFIATLRLDDYGPYSCVAQNEYGSARQTTLLQHQLWPISSGHSLQLRNVWFLVFCNIAFVLYLQRSKMLYI